MSNSINAINTIKWYEDQSDADKYVSCIVAMIDEFRKQGVSVGHNWLQRVSRIKVKQQWSLRRRFWLYTVQLRHAEWKKRVTLANDILDSTKHIIDTEQDTYTRQMYKVLEADCNVALHKITTGQIHPLFKSYHTKVLLIADDLLMLDQSLLPHKAFVEDCNRVFDVSSDIEKEWGSELYKRAKRYIPKTDTVATKANKKNVVLFKQNFRDLENIITYLKQWLGGEFLNHSYYSIEKLLIYVENARNYVIRHLDINPETLFSNDTQTDMCLQEKVQFARMRMVDELASKGVVSDKSSFWKLYIEIVSQKALEYMGENNHIDRGDLIALKQAARWPLHEKIHHVINTLAKDPDYLQHLLNKKIINSESLLYGVFARLTMKSVPVVYCGFTINDIHDEGSALQRHCYNGKGLERIYNELVLLVYKVTRQHIGKGFCLRFSDDTGMNLSLDIGCICTGKQVVMIGISKQFKLENYHYLSGSEVIGELFELVGFEFAKQEVINISGPKTPEVAASKLKRATIEPMKINIGKGFVTKLIGQETVLEKQKENLNLEPKFFADGLFEEIIEVAKKAA